MNMSKEKFLEKINIKIAVIRELEKMTRGCEKFQIWHHETATLLIAAFGEKARCVRQFNGIPYSPNFCVYNSNGYGPDYQKYYLKGLSSARALLTAICQEVKELVDDINVESSGSGDLWAYVHPRIVDVSKRTFDVEAYAESVEAAFKELNTQVKKRVRGRLKKELDGVQLMQTVFSVENPLLKVEHDIESKSGRDTQLGYMQMLAGAISAIRNPKAHENMVISREDAVRKLMFASMLMYKIEGAEICN